nr:hypothetical protein Iba_chr11bCG9100 [Ipomoea batatas]GME09927.1 hypothetical protein Iba_scaffold9221CG0100 [Ipomoea batatas]
MEVAVAEDDGGGSTLKTHDRSGKTHGGGTKLNNIVAIDNKADTPLISMAVGEFAASIEGGGRLD